MTLRTFILATSAIGAMLAVSACATTAESTASYSEELAQLTADCSARNGILTPIGNGTTGRPAADYACRLPAGTGRTN